ncbi:amino acid permease [Aestuariirhabdus litorea]|uniref:Arginine/agmatine antiporter n=1 Tax=Aestuariirhabdus litorea TaxID=2528527 RepID=A0A3P3VNK7_9GAMM|nr:amino acid permease [Aestuariirhabdus litorea]RRJ83289.1 amino acid permease [Aestuariirhabdus litorea]RWW93448.1 amino acid permease [Endozoicomonadaceae bacterium GTF-13]
MSASTKKGLGLWICTSLVVGNVIGSGIFLLPASLASYGAISLVGWVFTSIGALLLALVFARLSVLVPRAGGPYAYSREGLGDFAGFLIAWGHWIAVWAGNAAICVAFVSYLTVFFPVLGSSPVASILTGLAALWGLSLVNIRGIHTAGLVQLVTTVLKVLPLIAVSLVGLFYLNPEHFTPVNRSGDSNFSAITACAALTLWAYLGLESATVPADDVENPRVTIPRATILGTLFCALIYILSTVSLMGLIDPDQLATSNAPFADAARLMWGDIGYYAVGLGAVISCFGALNGWMILQGQVPHAAARDGLFPEIFKRVNRNGVPYMGILISSVLITVLMVMNYTRGLVAAFTFIILLATLTSLVPYSFSAIAELMILSKRRGSANTERLLGHSVIAMLGFLYSLWAIAGSGQDTVYWGFLLLMLGLPVYSYVKWQSSTPPADG